jgi:hypothetical protein
MAGKTKIRVKVTQPYDIVGECLGYAVRRGCDRHDKYSDTPLSEASRELLAREVEASFWLAADDRSIEFVK